MSFLSRLFATDDPRDRYRPLYDGIIAAGRDPAWFREGQVPDTVDGRFDIIAALLALLLLRLERDESAGRASVLIAELFIADMDGNIRQMGIGDLMVGKNVGKMMGALGGRLAAFRAALATDEGLAAPVRRNVFRDAPPSDAAVTFVSRRLERFHDQLVAEPVDRLLGGAVPQP